MFKRVVLLALLCVSFVMAKGYVFTVPDTVQAGTVQLKAGEYSVSVQGAQATFTDQYGHRQTTAVKVDKADAKFADTAVYCSNAGGKSKVDYIGLKGTDQKLVFNQ